MIPQELFTGAEIDFILSPREPKKIMDFSGNNESISPQFHCNPPWAAGTRMMGSYWQRVCEFEMAYNALCNSELEVCCITRSPCRIDNLEWFLSRPQTEQLTKDISKKCVSWSGETFRKVDEHCLVA